CFQGQARPRGPHSFPTRRSSDLRQKILLELLVALALLLAGVWGAARAVGSRLPDLHAARAGQVPPMLTGLLAALALVNLLAVLRSEEHTSELQSLAYLVCRLLLE